MNTTTNVLSDGGNKFAAPSPYIMSQPFNVLTFLAVFSPIILILIVLSYSLFYQNFKGFIYLGFLLACVTLRSIILQAVGSEKGKDTCGFVRYSEYGNPTISTFIFAFTLAYLSLPMLQVGVTNWFLIVFLMIYLVFDIMIKIMQGCITITTHLTSIIGNVFGGLLLGITIVLLMYAGGSQNYLFFADQTSNGTVCSMPKKQSFKCAVYKNGELVTSTNT